MIDIQCSNVTDIYLFSKLKNLIILKNSFFFTIFRIRLQNRAAIIINDIIIPLCACARHAYLTFLGGATNQKPSYNARVGGSTQKQNDEQSFLIICALLDADCKKTNTYYTLPYKQNEKTHKKHLKFSETSS